MSVTRLFFPLYVHTAVASQVHGFLSDPMSQAQSYWYLGTAALVTACACLAVPGPVASLMLSGTPDAVMETLVRAAGATLITSATVKYTLKVSEAKEQERPLPRGRLGMCSSHRRPASAAQPYMCAV